VLREGAGRPVTRCRLGHRIGDAARTSRATAHQFVSATPAAASAAAIEWKGTAMTRDYRKDPEAISRLSAQQRRVTQEGATEPAFRNEYWANKEAGIYVDIVSGEPLFASTSKYDSQTGWPSFTVPLEPDNIVERSDTSDGMVRTEVRSVHGDSHLGHLFDDGPTQAGGLRYCLNSAALRFVPLADLEAQGYGQYRRLFDATATEAPA
jgi:peptide-methionine (R)-S-oxide reductase